MLPDDNNAASSTALEDASVGALAQNDYAHYAAIENAKEAGERAGKPITEAPAPSTKPDQIVAEPGAAKPEAQEKKGKTGEDRKAELKAEIDELLRKRAELQGKIPATETGDKPAVPPPAPVAVIPPAAAAAGAKALVMPNLENFTTIPEYNAALETYFKSLSAEVVAADRVAQAAGATKRSWQESWDKRAVEATADHADFATVAYSPDTPVTRAMKAFIDDSDAGPRVLYRLGENGSAEGKRIAALHDVAAVKALHVIELEMLGTATAGKPAPVKRIVTAAPAPATDLGGKGTEQGDAAEAALARGEVGLWMSLMNARDAKARAG